ncbi:MAG: AI-2E family transporter [Thermomicrobiales bacterium]
MRWSRLSVIVVLTASLVLAFAIFYSFLILARPLAILLASIIIAVALAPLVDRIERWIPRGLAATLVYLGILVIVVAIVFALGYRMSAEFSTLADEFPRNRAEVENLIANHAPIDDVQVVDILRDQIGNRSGLIVRLPLLLSNALLDFVLAIFLSLYWVISAPKLKRFVLSLVAPGDRRQKTDDVLSQMGSTMGGYVRASVLDGIIVGVLTYIGLLVLGVRFATVLAIFAAFMELIPVIGPIVSAVPAVIVAFIDSPTKALMVLGFYILLQQIESNVLMPNVMRNQTDVPPVLSLFAVFAGGGLAGILGALIAVPLAGALMVLTQTVIAPAIRSRWQSSPQTESASP